MKRLAAVIGAVILTAAMATTWSSASAAAPEDVVGVWELDEPAGTQVLLDSGPQGLHGTIGSSVQRGATVAGAGAHVFSTVDPDRSPVDLGRLDVVAHDARMDPGAGDFAVTVRLLTTAPQGNVVQKGQASSTGGYFKVDMDDGRVACLFTGDVGTLHVRSSARIDTGRWTEVRCHRSATALSLYVDGVLVHRRTGVAGAVANTWPLTIAGKSSCNQFTVGCDYYSGAIDRVTLTRNGAVVAPPPPPSTSTTAAPSTSAAPPPTTSAPTTTATPTTTAPVSSAVVK
ncbi:MAG: LamG-like jellyroll fold domain-containing protein [Microthrixaceae bacterium]